MAGASVPHAAFAAFFQPAPPTPIPRYQPGEPISPISSAAKRACAWTKRQYRMLKTMKTNVRDKKRTGMYVAGASTRYYGDSGSPEVGPSYSAYEIADCSWSSEEPFLSVEPSRGADALSGPYQDVTVDHHYGVLSPSPASPDLAALAGGNLSPYALLSRDPDRLRPTVFFQPRVHSSGAFMEMSVSFESSADVYDTDSSEDDYTDSSEEDGESLASGTSEPEVKATGAATTFLRLVKPSPAQPDDMPCLPAYNATRTGAPPGGTRVHLDVGDAMSWGRMTRSPGMRNLSMCYTGGRGPPLGANVRLTSGVGADTARGGVARLRGSDGTLSYVASDSVGSGRPVFAEDKGSDTGSDRPAFVDDLSSDTGSDRPVFAEDLGSDTGSSRTVSSAMSGSVSSALSFMSLIDRPPAGSPSALPPVSALRRLLSLSPVCVPASETRAGPLVGPGARSEDAHVYRRDAAVGRVRDKGREQRGTDDDSHSRTTRASVSVY